MRLGDFVAALLAHGKDRTPGVLLGIVGEAGGTWGVAVALAPGAPMRVVSTVGPVSATALARALQQLERGRGGQPAIAYGCAVLPIRREQELLGYFITDGVRVDGAVSELVEILAGLLVLEPESPTRLRGAPDSTRRAAIKDALRECNGNVSRAAIRLGIARRTLYLQMERLGITVERAR